MHLNFEGIVTLFFIELNEFLLEFCQKKKANNDFSDNFLFIVS